MPWKRLVLFAALAGGLLAAARTDARASGAGVPTVVAFQGFLTDDEGVPVAGTVNLDVALYEVESGGVAVWTESHAGVDVANGVFTIELGAVTALPDTLFDASALWLGVSVNGETELPRTPLRTTPFAFRARTADRLNGVDADGFVRATGDTLTGPLRLEGGVEALAPGGGVTEIVASTTDVLLRRWFFSGVADSWNGVSARIVIVLNGAGGPGPPGGAGVATVTRNQTPYATLAIAPSGSRPAAYVIDVDVEDGASVDVAIRAVSMSAPVLVRAIYVETVGDGSATPSSLDAAYDAGGAGAGRTITADAGPVVIAGTDGLEVTGPLAVSGTVGDSSVDLPEGAVSSAERLDEGGIAQNRAPGNTVITDSFVEMVDVVTLTVTLPAPGYVHLEGTAQARFSASTTGNVMAVQIDETSGGPIDVSQYFFVGYDTSSPAGESYLPVHVTRTYLKPAGIHTFRLEAMDHDDRGSKTLWNATLTATYHPTAYGTVTTLVPPGQGGTPVWIEGNGGPSGAAEIIDLRDREAGRGR